MDDIKAAGIKGVTLSCKTYSGGQQITATITLAPGDLVSQKDFVTSYQVRPSQLDLYFSGEDGEVERITTDAYYKLPCLQQENARRQIAQYEYQQAASDRYGINQYYLDRYNVFSTQGMDKIKAVNAIISAYRYDASNTMVDYFDTNFYYDIYTKPAK